MTVLIQVGQSNDPRNPNGGAFALSRLRFAPLSRSLYLSSSPSFCACIPRLCFQSSFKAILCRIGEASCSSSSILSSFDFSLRIKPFKRVLRFRPSFTPLLHFILGRFYLCSPFFTLNAPFIHGFVPYLLFSFALYRLFRRILTQRSAKSTIRAYVKPNDKNKKRGIESNGSAPFFCPIFVPKKSQILIRHIFISYKNTGFRRFIR